jgi:hypothetical protein
MRLSLSHRELRLALISALMHVGLLASNTAHFVQPSESYDKEFAHKPWLLKHEGIVYHFYCPSATKAA